jgi:hypothetical protein
VGDEADVVGVDPVPADEQLDGLLGEHDEPVGSVGEAPRRRPERRRRVGQHRVQRGHHRCVDVLEQLVDVPARRSAEDAELVLDADDVDVPAVHQLRRRPVVADLGVVDLEDDRLAVVVGVLTVGQGHLHRRGSRVQVGERAPEVVGEGGDAAAPGWRRADEGDLRVLGCAHVVGTSLGARGAARMPDVSPVGGRRAWVGHPPRRGLTLPADGSHAAG